MYVFFFSKQRVMEGIFLPLERLAKVEEWVLNFSISKKGGGEQGCDVFL